MILKRLKITSELHYTCQYIIILTSQQVAAQSYLQCHIHSLLY